MLAKGKQNKFVVMRNNAPTAVLLPVSAYEALIEEVEDLRIEIVAIKRMRDFDRSKAITHDEMVKKFGSEGK